VSWAPALLWLFGVAILLCCAIVLWPRPRRGLRISNEELNAHRITPRFTVGSDAK
jgi:cytochrome c-type biogenesis protein CcmH/NrfF